MVFRLLVIAFRLAGLALDPKVKLVKLLQPKNAYIPILVTLFGIASLPVNELQR